MPALAGWSWVDCEVVSVEYARRVVELRTGRLKRVVLSRTRTLAENDVRRGLLDGFDDEELVLVELEKTRTSGEGMLWRAHESHM